MRSPRLTDAAAGVALVLFPLAARAHEVAHPAPDTRIVSNDNRHPAGTLRSGVLTVRIDARDGTWMPDGPTGHHYSVAAFAEAGKTATTPGPLLRVPLGAEVRATVRNTLGKTLWMYGLGAKRGVASDSVAIAPGASHEFRFRADAPGSSTTRGARSHPYSLPARSTTASCKGVPRRRQRGRTPDRIFLISNWFVFPDTTTVSGVGPHWKLSFNGRSWPNTERLDLVQGRQCALALRQRERAGASASLARVLLSRGLARDGRVRQHGRSGRSPAHGDRARAARRDDVDDVGSDAQRELDLPLPCGGSHLHGGGARGRPPDAG
jgi:hypothetical protein